MRMIDDTDTLAHSCTGYAAPHHKLTEAVRMSAQDRERDRRGFSPTGQR